MVQQSLAVNKEGMRSVLVLLKQIHKMDNVIFAAIFLLFRKKLF